jgi:hypothetical protein
MCKCYITLDKALERLWIQGLAGAQNQYQEDTKEKLYFKTTCTQ